MTCPQVGFSEFSRLINFISLFLARKYLRALAFCGCKMRDNPNTVVGYKILSTIFLCIFEVPLKKIFSGSQGIGIFL